MLRGFGRAILAALALATVPFLMYACNSESHPERTSHARAYGDELREVAPSTPRAERVAALGATNTLDTTGLRCILHSTKGTARVDSCAVLASPVVAPPAPVPPPPAPAPAPPPPPPPPVADTVVATVKVSPNPVTLAAGKTSQLTGGAYNAAGQLVPGAGQWVTDNAGVVTVNASGLITAVSAGTTNVEFHYATKTAWSTVTVTGTTPPPPPPTTSAIVPADSFSKSVGIATHFSYYDLAPYSLGANVTRLIGQIKALGVGFVRDGQTTDPNVFASYKALAPVKLVLVTQPVQAGTYSDVSALTTTAQTLGASAILAFEGPNEVDNNNGFWGGIPAYGPNTKTFQCAAYAKAHALGIAMISPTVTSGIGASYMADLTACADGATLHPYPGGGLPMAAVSGTEAYTGTFVKAKPFWITEMGYHSNVNGTVNHYQPGVSEAAQAKYITRQYLDYFKAGIVHASSYELVDEWNDAANDEANYGIIRNDGTPKPAYNALQALLAAVRDSLPTGRATTQFIYTLAGTTSTIRSVGLSKRNGRVDVLLWNDVPVYDVTAKRDLANAPVTVTVTLTTTPSKITALYPVSGSTLTPIAAAKSFQVSVVDSPVIVEITP